MFISLQFNYSYVISGFHKIQDYQDSLLPLKSKNIPEFSLVNVDITDLMSLTETLGVLGALGPPISV